MMNAKRTMVMSWIGIAAAIAASQPAQAQRGGVDWGRTVKLIKELEDQVEKYAKAFDHALGANDDVKKRKKVRTPPTYKLTDEHKKLSGMIKAIENLQVPGPIDTGQPEFKTDPKALNGNVAAKQREADKLIAFNRALRKQVSQMTVCQERLDEIARVAVQTERAGRRLRDSFASVHESAVVRAFFDDTFGFAWLDLEEVILPQISATSREAAKKAHAFSDRLPAQRRALEIHTRNLQALLPALGVQVPSNLEDEGN